MLSTTAELPLTAILWPSRPSAAVKPGGGLAPRTVWPLRGGVDAGGVGLSRNLAPAEASRHGLPQTPAATPDSMHCASPGTLMCGGATSDARPPSRSRNLHWTVCRAAVLAATSSRSLAMWNWAAAMSVGVERAALHRIPVPPRPAQEQMAMEKSMLLAAESSTRC